MRLYKDKVLSPDEVEEEVEQCITKVRNTTLKVLLFINYFSLINYKGLN